MEKLSGIDHCTREGSERQAREITKYWADRGIAVKVWAEITTKGKKDLGGVWGCRSNIGNICSNTKEDLGRKRGFSD